MRHLTKKIKIAKTASHKTSLLRNLAMALIIYEKIKTTEAKARAVTPFVTKLIDIAKKKEKRIAIREITALLQHENSSRKLLEVYADKYQDRTSGYIRSTKLGYRNGDNAPVVQLELI
jgi:large subunit ribosomal protein L17